MKDLRMGISLFLMLSAAACAAARSPAEATRPTPAGADSTRDSTGIQVQIDNQNFSDMNIYLLKSGSRWLIGQASGLRQTTLTIPEAMAPTDLRVRLIADPIGGSRPIATPVLVVPPGQRIYWSIGSDPAMSTASAG